MFGVLGMGSAPKAVIEAALNDIKSDGLNLVVPWYGKVTAGLEVVYDWALDNDVPMHVVALDAAKQPPKVLVESCYKMLFTENVTDDIVRILKKNDGTALILWDADDEATSVELSAAAIDAGVPTLELTNGLVPIVFSGDAPDIDAMDVADIVAETVEEAPLQFDRATLEVMPAAAVKRTAKTNGFDAKTKDEAIALLCGDSAAAPVASIIIAFENGNQIALDLTKEALSKVMALVTG